MKREELQKTLKLLNEMHELIQNRLHNTLGVSNQKKMIKRYIKIIKYICKIKFELECIVNDYDKC